MTIGQETYDEVLEEISSLAPEVDKKQQKAATRKICMAISSFQLRTREIEKQGIKNIRRELAKYKKFTSHLQKLAIQAMEGKENMQEIDGYISSGLSRVIQNKETANDSLAFAEALHDNLVLLQQALDYAQEQANLPSKIGQPTNTARVDLAVEIIQALQGVGHQPNTHVADTLDRMLRFAYRVTGNRIGRTYHTMAAAFERLSNAS
jgi:hypothetical protein